MQDEEATYNAWEEDFATLNIFFEQETVMSEILSIVSVRRNHLAFPRTGEGHLNGAS